MKAQLLPPTTRNHCIQIFRFYFFTGKITCKTINDAVEFKHRKKSNRFLNCKLLKLICKENKECRFIYFVKILYIGFSVVLSGLIGHFNEYVQFSVPLYRDWRLKEENGEEDEGER